MDNAPAVDPVNVIDHEAGHTFPGHVVVTMASCFSSFALKFKISNNQTLKEVKQRFGTCADWHSNSLEYLHNGKVVQDADTPAKLHMKNGDMIQVLAEAKFTGSCPEHRRRELSGSGFELMSVVDANNSLLIVVRHQDGLAQSYRIKPTTDFSKVMKDFEQKTQSEGLRFLVNGDRIVPGHTPEKLEMMDGDIVDAMREQHGGYTA